MPIQQRSTSLDTVLVLTLLGTLEKRRPTWGESRVTYHGDQSLLFHGYSHYSSCSTEKKPFIDCFNIVFQVLILLDPTLQTPTKLSA